MPEAAFPSEPPRIVTAMTKQPAQTPAAVDTARLCDVRHLCSTGAARAIRQAAALSLAEVAAHAGIPITTVSGWERGVHRPHGPAAVVYLDLLYELAKPASELRRARYGLSADG